MNREQTSTPQDQQEAAPTQAGEPAAAPGLPPDLHAHVARFGPGDSVALHATLVANPHFGPAIITIVAPRMGNIAIVRAVRGTPTATAVVDEGQTIQAKPDAPPLSKEELLQIWADEDKISVEEEKARLDNAKAKQDAKAAGGTQGTTETKPPIIGPKPPGADATSTTGGGAAGHGLSKDELLQMWADEDKISVEEEKAKLEKTKAKQDIKVDGGTQGTTTETKPPIIGPKPPVTDATTATTTTTGGGGTTGHGPSKDELLQIWADEDKISVKEEKAKLDRTKARMDAEAKEKAKVEETPHTQDTTPPVVKDETSSEDTADSGKVPAPAKMSPDAIASAKKYNTAHAHFVAQFNAATHNACLGADGHPDPEAVFKWQVDHGIGHDGKVGPQTVGVAAADAKKNDKATTDDHAKKDHVDTKKDAGGDDAKLKIKQDETAKHDEATPPKHDEVKPPPPKVDDGGVGSQARKIVATTHNYDNAFKVLVDPNDQKLDHNLADYGSVDEQRTLLDGVITAGLDVNRCQRAFHAYWHVQLNSAAPAAATTNGGDNGAPSPAVGARDWPIPTLQAIHHQLKLIPDHDARAGVWKKLSLTNQPNLINRAAYGGDTFWVGSNASPVGDVGGVGYAVQLTDDAGKKATKVKVTEGPRFKVGDSLSLGTKKNSEAVSISAIEKNEYTLAKPLAHDHEAGENLQPGDGSGERKVNWLDATVRHEIAHSLDGGGVDTKPYYAKGGWWLGQGDGGFESWVTAMGGEAAWKGNDGKAVKAEDRKPIKDAIVANIASKRIGSLFSTLGNKHPIMAYQGKDVPVISAADTCFQAGDNFWQNPTALHAANGKRFAISWWYQRFQYTNETAVDERVSEYSLYAPTEFFAEAYTIYYEEAGKKGVTEADYGRLIRNAEWRKWITDNVHNRGHAPAGTGAVKPAEGAPGAEQEDAGATPAGASRGRATGNPGL